MTSERAATSARRMGRGRERARRDRPGRREGGRCPGRPIAAKAREVSAAPGDEIGAGTGDAKGEGDDDEARRRSFLNK